MNISKGETTIKWFNLGQAIIGFCIGFFFYGVVFDKLISFLQKGASALPSEIPSWFNLLIAGGTIGIIICIILLIIAVKFFMKFAPFFMWLLVGIMAALLFNVVIPTLGIPNPFNWIMKKVGG